MSYETSDEMCRLLDERGVKWTSERVSDGVLFTFAKDGHTYSVFVRDSAGLEIWSNYLTPAQAIAATLGAGTCHDKNGFDHDTGFECTSCGAMVDCYMVTTEDMGHEVQFNFCPNCGAKVVDE